MQRQVSVILQDALLPSAPPASTVQLLGPPGVGHTPYSKTRGDPELQQPRSSPHLFAFAMALLCSSQLRGLLWGFSSFMPVTFLGSTPHPKVAHISEISVLPVLFAPPLGLSPIIT